jgi:hypothetical protein
MTVSPGDFTAYAQSLEGMDREQLRAEARRRGFSAYTLRARERSVMMSADPLLADVRGALARVWGLISLRRATVKTADLLEVLRGGEANDPGAAEYERSLEEMDPDQLRREVRRWRYETGAARQHTRAILESADALLATCAGPGPGRESGHSVVLGIRAGDGRGRALSAEEAVTCMQAGSGSVAVTVLGPDGMAAPGTEIIIHPRPTGTPGMTWPGGAHQDLAGAAGCAEALALATRLAGAAAGVRPPGQDVEELTANVPLTHGELTQLMQALNEESDRAANQGHRDWARRAITLSNRLLKVCSQLLPPAVTAAAGLAAAQDGLPGPGRVAAPESRDLEM